jgi:hypothetical protein
MNNALDLNLELLADIEAPLSNDFWTGVGIGIGIVAAAAGIVALT